MLLAERSKTRQTVCVCASELSRGREAYDKHAEPLEEGDNLGVEGKTTGLLPSWTQECRSGRIPVRVFECACVCIRSRQESLTPTDSGSTYQGLNKEGEGGEGSGYPALSHPPLTPITPSLELSHIHTGRDEH